MIMDDAKEDSGNPQRDPNADLMERSHQFSELKSSRECCVWDWFTVLCSALDFNSFVGGWRTRLISNRAT